MHDVLVKRGLVPRWVLVVLAYVLVLRFYCRWGVSLLDVVEVCDVASAFSRRGVVMVAGWQWLDAGPSVSVLW